MKSEMEKLLGGPIGSDGIIPGTIPNESREIIYFADDGKNTFRKQFSALTGFSNPPNAKSGGVTEEGCSIALPDGSIFHAIEYHGDIAGWRKDIEEGARGLELPLAKIEGNRIVTCDGRAFALEECKLSFY